MKKRTKSKRARRVNKAIRLVYGSLRTHLWFTHKKSRDGKKFHKKSVREYARTIRLLSKLY